jgi:hypothetical protein
MQIHCLLQKIKFVKVLKLIAVALVKRHSLLLWNKARLSACNQQHVARNQQHVARNQQHVFEPPTHPYSWSNVQDGFIPKAPSLD